MRIEWDNGYGYVVVTITSRWLLRLLPKRTRWQVGRLVVWFGLPF